MKKQLLILLSTIFMVSPLAAQEPTSPMDGQKIPVSAGLIGFTMIISAGMLYCGFKSFRAGLRIIIADKPKVVIENQDTSTIKRILSSDLMNAIRGLLYTKIGYEMIQWGYNGLLTPVKVMINNNNV